MAEWRYKTHLKQQVDHTTTETDRHMLNLFQHSCLIPYTVIIRPPYTVPKHSNVFLEYHEIYISRL